MNKIKEVNIKNISIHYKSLSTKKNQLFKAINEFIHQKQDNYKVNIYGMHEATSLPHNGSKLKKKRRL